MDDAEAVGAERRSSIGENRDRAEQLRQRLDKLLREAAAVEVELSRADGSIKGVPHYSVIEGRAHERGKQLSCEIQQRQMNEIAASGSETAKCPTCGTRCDVQPKKRRIKAIDGSLELLELVAQCPYCRRAFFPST